jgi:hypothetical protein
LDFEKHLKTLSGKSLPVSLKVADESHVDTPMLGKPRSEIRVQLCRATATKKPTD